MAIRNKLVALQLQRLDMTAELISQARIVLQNAHLEEADETQARALVGEMRLLVRDMAALQQRESVLLPEEAQKELNTVTITADDMRAAQRELERRQAEEQTETGAKTGTGEAAAGSHHRHRLPPDSTDTEPATQLLLCMGDDYEAVLDVKTLRTLPHDDGAALSTGAGRNPA